MMSPRPSRQEIVAAVVVLVFLVSFPWLNPGYRYLSLAITTGITSIALYGLGIQFGQAGIMSVGHAAFVGIGAYTAAILAGRLGVGFWLALPFSTLLSAVFAGLIGLPSLRVGGQHYIIITFCFCALFDLALTNGGTFTGAATGLDVGSIDPIFGVNFDQLRNSYYHGCRDALDMPPGHLFDDELFLRQDPPRDPRERNARACGGNQYCPS
jgi:branched-chain amino acid transport system permease protein